MKKANIYIVEDEQITAMNLQHILEDYGYGVTGIAAKGEEAVEAVQKIAPELIFMDIMLGGEMDGIAAARKIGEENDIPVVFITALSDEPTIKESLGTFPFGYITKPFNSEQIYIAVEIALYRHTIEKKLKQEIEQRKKAEETLREIEKSLHDAYKLAHIGAWDWKAGTDTVTWTEELYRIAGLDPMVPAPTYAEHSTIYTPESWKILKTAVERAMETGEPYRLELELIRPDGSTRYVNAYGGVKDDTNGRVNGLYGIVQDITERTRAEESLRQSEERFHGIVENVNVGYFFVDTEGYYRDVNRAWLDMHGYDSAGEVIGKSFSITQVPEELETATALGKKLIDGTPIRYGEFTRLRKDGSVGHHIYSSRPVVKDGRAIGIDGFMIDITERKNAEQEIQDLSRHLITIQEEERQRVARDLHDSVGQTVLAAKLNIEAYRKNKSDMERLGKGLAFLDRASQELRSIYTGLYPSILEDLGLEAAVRWYAKHFLEANGISASLDFALEAEIGHDTAVNLYRIIQEILSNVMKHSGADSVRLQICEKGGVITVTVQDRGIGFDEKKPGVDSFGLRNLRYRARLLGGECRIDSKDGEGTTITVTAMRTAQ